MNNLNKTIKKIIFFCIFLFSSVSYASENNIDYDFVFTSFGVDNIYNEKNIETIIKNAINLLPEQQTKKISKLFIEFNITNKDSSLINGDSIDEDSNCYVHVNYKKNNLLFFNNLNEDITFILLHEISHCVLGKEQLYKNNINWMVDVTKENLQELSLLENLSLSMIEKNKNNLAYPYIVYHEMFADINAVHLMITKKEELAKLKKLIKARKTQFKKNKLSSSYTDFAFPFFEYFLKNNTENKIDDLSIKITQLGFIKYLDFMRQNYNLRKIYE